ncbi:MAG: efflux RND transporter periplasmic adaptor subunit [Gemmatimonadaceae bacterium]
MSIQRALRTPLIGATLATTAVILLSACKAAPSASATAAPRDTNEVILGPTSPQLAYIGTDTVVLRHERTVAVLPAQLALDEVHTVRVMSPLTGRAESVDVQLGDVVQRGAALARLSSGDLAQIRSDVAKARAALSQDSTTLVRTRDLYEHHVAAAKDLEQATNDEAQARAEAVRTEARLRGLGDRATDIAGTYVIRAPISGTVVGVSLSAGTEVRADAASPLFVISALDTLWLVANVYQRDLAMVHAGSSLDFTTDAVPNRHFLATVTYVGNDLDSATHTATVRASLPNPGRILRAQTSGEARLLTPTDTPLLTIPTTALVTHGSEIVVFVEVRRGQYARRVVTVADDDGKVATITSGLQPGERVVTTGTLLLAAEADRAR